MEGRGDRYGFHAFLCRLLFTLVIGTVVFR